MRPHFSLSVSPLSMFTMVDGAVITLFDGPRPPIGASLGRVSRGRKQASGHGPIA